MPRIVRVVYELMSPASRRAFALLLPAMIVTSMLELAVVASVAAFLQVLGDRAVLSQEGSLAATVYQPLSNVLDEQMFVAALGAGVFGLLVVGNVFTAVTAHRVFRFSWLQNHEIASRLLAAYLHRPYDFFLQHSSSGLTKHLLHEVQTVVQHVIVHGAHVFSRMFGVLLIVGWLMARDPLLSLLLASTLGAAYVAMYYALRRRLYRMGKDKSGANEERFRVVNESFSGVKELKLLGLEDQAVERFRDPSRRFAMALATHSTITQVPKYILECVAVGGLVITMVYMVLTERLLDDTLPVVGTYAVAAFRLLPTLQAAFVAASNIRFDLFALEDIHESTTRSERVARPEPVSIPFEGAIELRGVTYRYPTAARAQLDGLHLTLHKGAWTAFIGSTGSGKTTLVDLVMGLLRPDGGEVCIDGRPLRTAEEIAGWQSRIGYVPQHIFMSDDTIARNIAFGIGLVDTDRVHEVAQVAAIAEFVERELPEGYETRVGDRGVRLSGGQRQRIGLARALYRAPAVLVLDEATSALDNETEARVIQQLRAQYARTTVLMIAHRLSTTRYCDDIVVLESGRVVDRGTYDHLERNSVRFRELLEASHTGPRPDSTSVAAPLPDADDEDAA